jgi:hypothetical protein
MKHSPAMVEALWGANGLAVLRANGDYRHEEGR